MPEHDPEITETEAGRRDALKRAKPYVYEKVQRYAERYERGESIAMIQFQYDYRCNFSCEHCCIANMEKKPRRFTIPDVRELARQADEMGLAQFVITGGEPLVFPDLDDLVAAIDPQRFHITMDSNGWFLDLAKARHLKEIGIDKIQLSLDSIRAEDHDEFRHHRESFDRAMGAIDACLEVGLPLIIQTVVPRGRIFTDEFRGMLEFAKGKGIGVFVTFAKPVGAWAGNMDVLATEEDLAYERELEKDYDVFTHMTPSYGMHFGCIAVKRMFSITMYGDVMPCPYIHVSLGNVFEEPLADIVARGLRIKWFRDHYDTCLAALDRPFIDKYMARASGESDPAPLSAVFTDEDYVDGKAR